MKELEDGVDMLMKEQQEDSRVAGRRVAVE